jgi:hypothetical protein
MSSLTVVTPPAAQPLPLTLIKSHCRITIKDDDELLKVYAAAALDTGESATGRSFVNKLYCQAHDRFPSLHDWGGFGTGYFYQTRRYSRREEHDRESRQEIKLLRCPLVSVQSIQYLDLNGNLQTLLPAPELWEPNTEYSLGDQAQDSNGNLQQITAVDDSKKNQDGTFSSVSAAPTWSQILSPPGTTQDGPFTWTIQGVAPAGDFLVDQESEPPRITPPYGEFWPQTLAVPNAVKIFFTAGYGNSGSSVPAAGKILMLQLINNWYENREPVTSDALREVPYGLEYLAWSITVRDYAPTK